MIDAGIDWRKQYLNLESQMETMLLAIAKRMDSLEKSGNQTGRIHDVQHRFEKGKITVVNVAYVEDPEFAWYVYMPNGNVKKIPYSRSNTLVYEPKEVGTYRVGAYVRIAGKKQSVLVQDTGKVVVSTLQGSK